MRAWRILLAGIAALHVAGGLAAARASPAASPAPSAAMERQILVFLRMPSPHFRPNADYGGGYGDGESRAARLRVAGQLARKYGIGLLSQWPMTLLGVDCFIMTVPDGQSPADVADRISRDPGVSWSQPVNLYTGQAAPAATHNDPLYRAQPAAAGWRLAELHRISTGRGVRVAVIDSMVETAHPDLQGQVEASENFVPVRTASAEPHGTSVAGVIAARSDNALGIAGVAPGARLLALRACWQEGGRTICDSLSLARALDFAISRRAQVINMSLSGPPDPLLGKLLDVARARGAVVVGAFDRGLVRGGFPASHPGVVAVVDDAAPPIAGVLSAPGRDVPTTQPGGRWFPVSGSSYAAAHVSGLLALLRERASGRGDLLHPVIARSGDTVDACATLLQRSGSCDCAC